MSTSPNAALLDRQEQLRLAMGPVAEALADLLVAAVAEHVARELDAALRGRELLVGTAEAARRLGISERSLYHLVERGELEPVKVGRKTLFRTDDLAAFVDRLAHRDRPRDVAPGLRAGRGMKPAWLHELTASRPPSRRGRERHGSAKGG